MTAITDDAASTFVTGRRTINAVAVQISATALKLSRGVEIKAAAANSGSIYVGNSSSVTADSADATDGFQIAAGEKTVVPIDDLSKLWLIGSAASQKFFYKAL